MTKFIEDLGKVPVLRVLFPLVIGIILERGWETGQFSTWLIGSALGLLFLSFIFRSITGLPGKVSAFLLLPAFFLLFISAGIFHTRSLDHPGSSCFQGGQVYVSGIVSSDPEEKANSYVVAFETEYFVSKDSVFPIEQIVLLYIPKDSLAPVLVPGQRWLFRSRVQEIRNNGNPGEFDYAAFMLRKGISSLVFTDPGSGVQLFPSQEKRLKYLPGKIRRKIRSSWDLHDPDHAVLSAITLGDKSMIPTKTRDAFVGSGAMHLLAVSGLHVGMIWWILDLLIAFPRRKAAFRILKVVFILSILWMYAGITGFSESVSRSVTMFSLISLARAISRNSNIYNTLFLSAFILLVIDPLRIEEPGFQLSYLAVFGIVSIHPLLEKMLPVPNKILKRLSDLVFVSIAAQLATLPVSLIYFHQFPVYFIFTNILAIPLVSVVLALFVVFSPFFILDFHPEFFLGFLEWLSHLLNQVVGLISSLPGSAIRDIPMSTAGCLLLVLVIFSLTGFALYKRVSWLLISMASACCILFFSGVLRLPDPSIHELHVYNFKDCTVLTSISNRQYKDYLFYQDEPPGRYVMGYLQSRGKMNRQCTDYELIEINVSGMDSLIDQPGDGLLRDMIQICDGAWGTVSGGSGILICGACSGPDLDRILEHASWDIVVFRKDYPWISALLAEKLSTVTCIADASLKEYELKGLKAVLPELFITSEVGAWSNIPR